MDKRRGVTLIEMMVVVAVSALVLTAILNIFGAVTRQWGTQMSRSNALQAANLALDLMAKEIHEAMSYTPGGGSLPQTDIFALPANTDADGNYVPTLSGGTLAYRTGGQFRFYLGDKNGGTLLGSGTCLWRESKGTGILSTWTKDEAWSLLPGGSAAGPKVCDVTSLAFSTDEAAPHTVRVTLTVEVKEGHQATPVTLQRDVYLSHHN